MNKKGVAKQTRRSVWRLVLKAMLIFIGSLVAIVILLVVLQGYLDRREAQKFANLQEDFIAIQDEFNKVHPGWERREYCVGSGSFNEQKVCYQALKMSADFQKSQKEAFNQYLQIVRQSDLFSEINESPPYADEQLDVHWASFTKRNVEDIKCSLGSEQSSHQTSQQKLQLLCRGDASNFHYKEE